MLSSARNSLCRTLILSIFLSVLPGWGGSYEQPTVPQATSDESRTSPEKKIRIAFAQHEMIMLLVENKSFDKILPELKKMLGLRLPVKYEEAVVKSLIVIASKLSEAKQLQLAHKVLDDGFISVTLNTNKANILRFKAYLFKEAGDLETAIETFKRANELEEKGESK